MYYYGFEDDGIFYYNNLEDFIDTIDEDRTDSIIVEMKTTNDKRYPRQCSYQDEFYLENSKDYCGSKNCNDYIPRNGKRGICEYNVGSLKETGRKWRIINDANDIEKISGRK